MGGVHWGLYVGLERLNEALAGLCDNYLRTGTRVLTGIIQPGK